MEKRRLNWFERYSMGMIDRFGGVENLLIGAICSFGMMGFAPNFSHKGTLSSLFDNECKEV